MVRSWVGASLMSGCRADELGALHEYVHEDDDAGELNPLAQSVATASSAKAVAQEIGVTADSVNRYRRGARKHARADVAAKIDDAVRQRWQPLVRKRRRKQAATATGITVETRAQFGYSAAVGTTDDGRFRRLTVHLPGVRAAPVRRPRRRGQRPADARNHRRRV